MSLTDVSDAPSPAIADSAGERPAWPPLTTWQYRGASVLLYFLLTCWLYGTAFFSNSTIINGAGADMVQEVWFLAWPAHAILHGQNIFYSNAMNYPHGLNLMANTSMPLLGVLGAPVTWIFGPVVTYTLLMRLAYICSAASAQFVARRIGLGRPAALAAGLLYGFSTVEIVEGWGHLFLVFAPIPPLVLYAVYCLLIGRWSPVRAGLTAGVLSALDFLISAERSLMTVLALVVLLLVAAVVKWRAITWRLVRDVIIAGACAGAAALVILAYPIHEMLGPGHVSGVAHSFIQGYATQVADFVFPGVFTWWDPFHMKQNIDHVSSRWENGAYIGFPLLIALIVATVKGWRHRLVRIGAVATLIVLGMSIGRVLRIDGKKNFVLTVGSHHLTLYSPYKLLTHIPYVENIEPIRLMYLAWLGIALLGGYALQRLLAWQRAARSAGAHGVAPGGLNALVLMRGAVTVGVATLVVVSLWPARPTRLAPTEVASWLTSSQMDATIPANSAVLFFPYPTLVSNHPMLDQAVGDFHYKIIGGEGLYGNASGKNVGIQPLLPIDLPTVFIRPEVSYVGANLASLPFTLPPMPPNNAATAHQFREYVTNNHVSTIVMEFATSPPALVVKPYLVAAFGAPVSHDQGSLLVWSLMPSTSRTS